MFSIKSLFLMFTILVNCKSSFVENLVKCQINDGDCVRDSVKSIIRDISKTGVPELGIPQLDPVILKNISITVLDLVNISLIDGNLKGIKDCEVDKVDSNFKDGRWSIELTCDITLKGQYKVFSSSPVIKSLFGADTIHGEGNGKVKIDKLKIKVDFIFFIQRRNDELYFKCQPDKTTYSYDFKGKVQFFADNLYLGKEESSKLVTELMNENWRLLMTTFGKPFMDKAMEIISEIWYSFYDAVPTKYFISDDLSQYLKN